jgi:hypothetical protein
MTKTTKYVLIGLGVATAAGIAYIANRPKQTTTNTGASGNIWDDIFKTSKSVVNEATAAIKQIQAKYPPGTLIRKGNDSAVYLIGADGTKQHITTREKFEAMGYNFSQVQSVSLIDFNAIPTGSSISGLGCTLLS